MHSLYMSTPPLYPILTTEDYVDLNFVDGSIIKISRSFYDKHDALKVKITNYDSAKFRKYICPLIYGESLKGLSYDETQEIDELIDILHVFHISDLTDEQYLNLGEASGIIKKCFRIKNFLLSKSKVKDDGSLKIKDKDLANRIATFATDFYKLLLALNKSNSVKYSTSFLSINYDYVINLIMLNQYTNMCKLNLAQWNIISIFCDYFISFIIDNKDKFYCLINLNLSFTIEQPSLVNMSAEQSILDQIKSLLSGQTSINPSLNNNMLTSQSNPMQPTISQSIIPALSKVLTTGADLFKF